MAGRPKQYQEPEQCCLDSKTLLTEIDVAERSKQQKEIEKYYAVLHLNWAFSVSSLFIVLILLMSYLITPITAKQPPPPPSDTIAGYNPWLDKPRPTKINDFLMNFEVTFIIDDSESMEGRRWNETRDALATIAEYALNLPVHTMNLRFLNDPCYICGLKGKKVLTSLFDTIKPKGATPLGGALNAVFDDHLYRTDSAIEKRRGEYSKIPPLVVIVLTDGMPTDDPVVVAENAAKLLNDKRYHPNIMSVQIVQIDDTEKTKKALRSIAQCQKRMVVDIVPYGGIVETVPYDGCSLDSQKLKRILLEGQHPNIRLSPPDIMPPKKMIPLLL